MVIVYIIDWRYELHLQQNHRQLLFLLNTSFVLLFGMVYISQFRKWVEELRKNNIGLTGSPDVQKNIPSIRSAKMMVLAVIAFLISIYLFYSINTTLTFIEKNKEDIIFGYTFAGIFLLHYLEKRRVSIDR